MLEYSTVCPYDVGVEGWSVQVQLLFASSCNDPFPVQFIIHISKPEAPS